MAHVISVSARLRARPGAAFRAAALLALVAILIAACTSRRLTPASVQETPPNRTASRSGPPPVPVLKPRPTRNIAVDARIKSSPAQIRDTTPAPPKAVRVKRGETVYAISRKYRVPARSIIVLNQLAPPYRLEVGQMLNLPVRRYHTVQRGDTVYGVSRRYGVDMSALVRANNVPPPYRLEVGRTLNLPSPTQVAHAQPAVVSKSTKKATAQKARVTQEARVTAPSKPKSIPSKLPPRESKYFEWPVKGRVVSSFGAKKGGLHNDGINIAVPAGSPVRAAENGVVAYAGNELRGFGNLVLVRHQNGWVSAYGHNDTLLVQRGDVVKRGQVIARSGRSGNVSSPQAHFELRKKGKPVDPRKYLARS